MSSNRNTEIIEKKIENKKVAIYIRVSTHWQVDKDSLQVQKRELVAYSKMILNINDYEVFEDAGYSAKNTDRPEYQRMMFCLRSGEFSHLLVWKIDRISRNLLDFSQMYSELKDLGITFVSKNEQFDTSSAMGEAMLKIILVFAELERNMTSERVSSVMLSRAANGQWNGGRVCFGYSWDKEKQQIFINEAESSVVKRIFNLYEERQSVLFVSRYLNDNGYTTRSGKTWSAVVIHEILTNPFYIGIYRYNMRKEGSRQKPKDEDEWVIIQNHHEPIITEKQFDRIQFILHRNARGGNKKGETHTTSNIHLFAGLLKCGNCGANMSATLDKRRANGFSPSVYGCATRRNNKSQCTNKYITDIYIGPFVFNFLANIIKASNTTTENTTDDVLQRKLLRGEAFKDVTGIELNGLKRLREMLIEGQTGIEFQSNVIDNEKSGNELSFLLTKKKKSETALNRLKSLYLYSTDAISEKDYLIEQKKIVDDLDETEKKINELKISELNNSKQTDNFLELSSYFMVVEKLIDERYVNYEKYISKIDKAIPRTFLKKVIDKIEITNGKITEIDFINDELKIKFLYE